MPIVKTQHNSLIPIANSQFADEVRPCVDAYILHKWLENDEPFTTWIKQHIRTYRLVENEDFILISIRDDIEKKLNKKQKDKGYLLTLDVAKELSMMENSERGRIARRYFIDFERNLRQSTFSLIYQFNSAVLDLEKLSEIASNAGRTLCLIGKQYKPRAKYKVDELKSKLQPLLL